MNVVLSLTITDKERGRGLIEGYSYCAATAEFEEKRKSD
jgi:hypothetical protein